MTHAATSDIHPQPLNFGVGGTCAERQVPLGEDLLAKL